MSLAEGIQARVVRKFYASGTITAGSEPVPATAPGASDGQIMRRVSANFSLSKDTYESAEVRTDRQVADFRHGTKRVPGTLSGELSPLTYADDFEALFRSTWGSAVTIDPSDATSVEADNTTSTFTFAAGAPVTLGLRVGQIIRFTGLADTDNNDKNFTITGFSGTSNRVVAVDPAPDTMSPDTSFSLTGYPLLNVPSSSFVSRLAAVEIYHEDLDIARLFTECRYGSARLQLPATGMSTVEFGLLGRNQVNYEGSFAPFFTAPSAVTTTGIGAAVNGLLRIGGVNQGVVTGVDIAIDLSPTADPVVGTDLVPEIFLGRARVSGTFTAFLEDFTLVDNFVDEDEIQLLLRLDASSDANAAAMTILLPRIKLGSADVQVQGEGGQLVSFAFTALKYVGSGAGLDATTIQICDTEQT